jgi:putative peptidoglycan lipid II flippase
MISRILGLIRDIVCLRYFGAVIWHYFSLGFMIPNLFRRLFGEGALTAALIPVYTETLHRDAQAAKLLVRSIVTLLFLILTALTLAGVLCVGLSARLVDEGKTLLTLNLAMIMLPYLVLVCLTATLGGILHVHRRFAAPAATPIVLNCCIIATVLFFKNLWGDDPWRQIYGVGFTVLGAGLLQLVLQIPPLWRAGVSLRPRFLFGDESLKKVMRLMMPMMIGMSVIQFNVLFDSLIAYFLSATDEAHSSFTLFGHSIAYPVQEGSISYLYLSQRLYQLPLGVFGLALATAIFPLLSRFAVEKKSEEFTAALAQGIRLVLYIALPATVGLVLVGKPLITVFFEWGDSSFTPFDTQQTAWTLSFYALGLCAYCLQQLVVRAYYSYQDAVTPVKVALGVVGINLVLNLILIWPLGTGGLGLATVIGATVQVSILLVLLIRRHDIHFQHGILICLFKSLVATGLMTGGCLLILRAVRPESAIVELVAILFSALVIYAVASWLLKCHEFRILLRKA